MLGLFSHHKDKQLELTVSNKTVIRVLALVIGSFVFLQAVRTARHALTLIFIAFFLALALNGPVHWLAERLPGKRKGSRSLATTISFVVIMGLLIGFIASIVPPLVRQTNSFISAAPGLVENVRNQDSNTGKFIRRHHLEGQVDKFSGQLSARLKNLGGSAFGTLTRIAGSVFSVLTVLVLTFMMLIEGPRWLDLIKRLLPDNKERHAQKLGLEMYKVVRGYINGQVLLAAIASVMILVPLLILHVSYPIALMVVVFTCGLIPLVGHSLGAVIVSTIALFHSPVSAIIILAYYILYQQIENYVLQPKIQANNTNMSPLLVFSSVIIGVSFSGLLGGLVAIPIAGCLRILVLDYFTRHDVLEPLEEAEKNTA